MTAPKVKTTRKPKAAPVVLVLRTSNADGTAHGGFVWPKSGPVECPDWRDNDRCGNGLHGALWGEGDGDLFRWQEDALWQVVEVLEADVRELGGKVKFPRGVVVHTGDRQSATEFLAANGGQGRGIIGGTATAGDSGTATAGYRGTATAGDRGTATAGYRGTATAGDSGTATAGDSGTATAGYRGTATAGDSGTVCIRWWDEKNNRYRQTVGYIGEDGLLPGTAYRCDAAGQIVPAL